MQKPRVLVIDDDDNTLSLICHLLECDYEVVRALGGADGLALAISQIPDLIIVDVQMPDVDGRELLTKIKAAKVTTRVVIMSGVFKSLRDTVNFVRLGACDVIHKPFQPDELKASVKRALALEDPLSLFESEPSLILREATAEKLALKRKLEEQKRRLETLGEEKLEASRKLDFALEQRRQLQLEIQQMSQRRFLVEVILVRLLYLAAVAAVTILFYRLRMIEPGTLLYVFPAALFVLLSLPFERIKGFIAKLKKAEGRATFK